MTYQLKNTYVTATFSAKGAELISLKDQDATEYIWQADPTYWGRHAPILFPLVGKVTHNTYTHKGETYHLNQHGFARDCTFDVVSNGEDTLVFSLSSTEETRKLFPFDFELKVTYTLHEKSLKITYDVINNGQELMGFKLGAHPGFRCPLFDHENFEDYVITFDKAEDATLMPLTQEGYFTHETLAFKGQELPLTHDLFAHDALVFTNLKSQCVKIRSKHHNKGIQVDFADFVFLGIWSPLKPSPFVCIEPWTSHADYVDESSEWLEKSDLLTLLPQKHFSCTHCLTLLG